jgi:hypothetical protein
MTDTPPEGQPKLARNRKWRDWNVTTNRAIRMSDGEWADLGFVASKEGSDRTAILRAASQRHVKAWKRKNPDVALPSETEASES